MTGFGVVVAFTGGHVIKQFSCVQGGWVGQGKQAGVGLGGQRTAAGAGHSGGFSHMGRPGQSIGGATDGHLVFDELLIEELVDIDEKPVPDSGWMQNMK